MGLFLTERDVIERAIRLAVISISWAKLRVNHAMVQREPKLLALRRHMDQMVGESRDLVVAAHRLGHLDDRARERWLDQINQAATFDVPRRAA